MNRRNTLTTYFGVFIVIIVIVVIVFFCKKFGGSQNFVYQDSQRSSKARCLQNSGVKNKQSSREKLKLERNRKRNNHVGTEFQENRVRPVRNRVSPRQHPVLEYQRNASYDTVPANYGDPIRPLSIGASPAPSHFRSSGNGFGAPYAYDVGGGPYPGGPIGVPVPQGALKLSSEADGYPFYSSAMKRGGYEGQSPSYPFHYQKKPLGPYYFFKPS